MKCSEHTLDLNQIVIPIHSRVSILQIHSIHPSVNFSKSRKTNAHHRPRHVTVHTRVRSQVMLFRTNDPFHFAKLPTSWISLWRIETLNSWEHPLYMYANFSNYTGLNLRATFRMNSVLSKRTVLVSNGHKPIWWPHIHRKQHVWVQQVRVRRAIHDVA